MTLTVTKPSRPRARNAGARGLAPVTSRRPALRASGFFMAAFPWPHFRRRGALRRRSTSSACRVDSRPADIARRLPRARCAKAGFARDARAPHVGETYTLSNVGANVLQGKACAPRRSQSGRPRKRGAITARRLGTSPRKAARDRAGSFRPSFTRLRFASALRASSGTTAATSRSRSRDAAAKAKTLLIVL